MLKVRKDSVNLRIFYILLCTVSFCGCGKEKENTEFGQLSKIPGLIANTEMVRFPESVKKEKVYHSFSDDLLVYLVQDEEQSILVEYQDKEAMFDWNYDLNCGKPMFYLTEEDALKLLYIALPTKDCETAAINVAGEICGERHIVRLGSTDKKQWRYADEDFWMKEVLQADEAQEDFWMEWEETENGRCPVLHSGTNQELNHSSYAYPALQELEQEDWEFVQEDVLFQIPKYNMEKIGMRIG